MVCSFRLTFASRPLGTSRRGNAARLCALAGAPCAAKAVLATLLALPGAQGKKGAPGGGARLKVNPECQCGIDPIVTTDKTM